VGVNKIGSILILNHDRQPARWRRVFRELNRLRTYNGDPLTSIATRIASVDARDGRAVAATADVDPNYYLGDQLHVQPDSQLEAYFSVDEPIHMTRQEVAVARSHIEAWKVIATGEHKYVLILEDDVWFTPRAAFAIERGWQAALDRCHSNGGPRLLYMSYEDAGKTAERAEPCDDLFGPIRGLWFLSGYVLSRDASKRPGRLIDELPVPRTRGVSTFFAGYSTEKRLCVRQLLFRLTLPCSRRDRRYQFRSFATRTDKSRSCAGMDFPRRSGRAGDGAFDARSSRSRL
jgi:GR25 family glycosyltransferase involved in LPS biosynthesis